jgi:hypothetical protein
VSCVLMVSIKTHIITALSAASKVVLRVTAPMTVSCVWRDSLLQLIPNLISPGAWTATIGPRLRRRVKDPTITGIALAAMSIAMDRLRNA